MITRHAGVIPGPAVLLLLFSVFALAGCSGERQFNLHGKYGGTLEMAGEDFKTLDPALGYDVPGWGFERLMYTSLLDYDDGSRLLPKGATSWTISSDRKTYVFRLRRGVCFEGPVTHNRPVVSADYAYELTRVLDPRVASGGLELYTCIAGSEAFHNGKAKIVEGIRTPDPHTLEIQLSRPNPAFLNIMALPFASAVPREVVEKWGATTFTEHAEGSGPFKLAYWRRNLDILLRRNPHYWEPGIPYLDGIHETFGVEALNSMMLFETGQLDISGIPTPDFVRITRDPRFAPYLDHQVQNAIYYLSLNCEMPPLDRVKVRQAINYAIDRTRLLRLINNRGVAATGVLPPGMPGCDPALRGYPYDPEKARSLLRQAGFPNGFRTTIWVRSGGGGGDEVREAQSIQQDLKAVGIDLAIKPVTFPVWEEQVSHEKTVPISINDWYQDYPDPSDFIDILLSSKQALPQDGNNNAFYKSAGMDALISQAGEEPDPEKRLEIYRQANRLAVHDAPWVFLYYPVSYTLRRPWVHDYRQHPVWPARYELIWFSKPGPGHE